ncbi:response regulator [Streptomyces fungicidicus]|uniref:response regulator transcription factor n=1 Tax=Streptomyces TaxID=1883 RepID=UPI0011676456|nr:MULTISPECIES: response regulator transcription factor [Streptomyces]QKW03159.1 response regulator transcription factor [Streptomyces sp. NA02536]TQL19599.1 LuxR family two component transcriptional regulator [Streptomyces sp. SLBN-134]
MCVIRVLLAEDVQMVREALAALLELEDDIRVVAEVGSGEDVLDAARGTRPDLVIVDVNMPGLDGLTAAERLREQLPDSRILVLTVLDAPNVLRRAQDVRVDGYLVKNAPVEHLVKAVRQIMAGERVISPELALAAWEGKASPLTAREADVLRIAAAGAETAEIAEYLHLSPGTVRNYMTTIIAKLDARNRLDAIRIARDAGWLLNS